VGVDIQATARDDGQVKTLAIGVDGARGGWVAAILRGSSLELRARARWQLELRMLERIEELEGCRQNGDGKVAIDIPIGLPEAIEFRKCDREGRTILGGQRNTVFVPPCRAMLELKDYAAVRKWVAAEKAKDSETKGVSAQAAALIPKVAEVDAWLRRDLSRNDWVLECHPELAFRTLNDGGELPSKRTAAGSIRRLRLVNEFFGGGEESISNLADRGADLSDALDACAALSVAIRYERGQTQSLGGEIDRCELPMRMVA
jgi:predicted RNase H-like nuclease